MPFRHNPLFVARDGELKTLAQVLQANQTVVITGLGGVGKTQLAIEFVHAYGSYFAGGIFWLSFADPRAIPAEVAACGGAGGLELRPDYHTLPLSEQVRLTSAAWQSALPRLLVFDNCEEEISLAQWRPATGESRVLVTSRRAVWASPLNVHVLQLGVLNRPESIALLRKHRPDLESNDANLNAIAKDLGDLPLALHLAGGFLATYRRVVSPAEYLAQLRQGALARHPSLEGRGTSLSPTNHELNVARTFALSYDRLDPGNATDTLARALLARLAYLAPGEPVPRDLLYQTLSLPGTSIQGSDPEAKLQTEDAFTRLTELGLLEEGVDGMLRQHRLLTAFIHALLHPDTEAQQSVERALLEVFAVSNSTGELQQARVLENHLRAVTELAIARRDPRAVELCNCLGNHLRSRADYQAARFFLERALEMQEALLGKDTPGTAISLNDLGLVLGRLGIVEAAREHLERALKLFVMQQDYSNAAACLDNLGQIATGTGEHEAARLYLTQALEIRQKVLGPQDVHTAISLTSLGDLLTTEGRYPDAMEHYRRALAIRETALGVRSRGAASASFRVGFLLELDGRFTESGEICERALSILDSLASADDPLVIGYLPSVIRPLVLGGAVEKATQYLNRLKRYLERYGSEPWGPVGFNNLGLTFWYCGHHREAMQYYNAVPADQRDSHATYLNNQAMAQVAFREYAAAREQYEKALHLQRTRKNADDLLTSKILNNSGVLHRLTKAWASAQRDGRQALSIRKKMLGLKHRESATTLSNLGLLYQELGQAAKAQKHVRQALAICRELYGDEQPDTAQMLHDLGTVLHAQGEQAEARACLEQSSAIRDRMLLEQHPLTADSLVALGKVMVSQGESARALECFQRAAGIYRFRYGENHPATVECNTRIGQPSRTC
jgi:tetratricopeptide (TPR) repeat protein